MSVLFSGSRSPRLSLSITTDQVARSGFIAGENDSLGGREQENKTNNFVRFLLGHTVLNWKIVYHILLLDRPPYPDGMRIVWRWCSTPYTDAKETLDSVPVRINVVD